jgi:hypothetical protein
VAANRLGEDEAYLNPVREILSEASTAVPPRAGLRRERREFLRGWVGTLWVLYRGHRHGKQSVVINQLVAGVVDQNAEGFGVRKREIKFSGKILEAADADEF